MDIKVSKCAITDQCVSCGACVDECPVEVIKLFIGEDDDIFYIDQLLCNCC